MFNQEIPSFLELINSEESEEEKVNKELQKWELRWALSDLQESCADRNNSARPIFEPLFKKIVEIVKFGDPDIKTYLKDEELKAKTQTTKKCSSSDLKEKKCPDAYEDKIDKRHLSNTKCQKLKEIKTLFEEGRKKFKDPKGSQTDIDEFNFFKDIMEEHPEIIEEINNLRGQGKWPLCQTPLEAKQTASLKKCYNFLKQDPYAKYMKEKERKTDNLDAKTIHKEMKKFFADPISYFKHCSLEDTPEYKEQQELLSELDSYKPIAMEHIEKSIKKLNQMFSEFF